MLLKDLSVTGNPSPPQINLTLSSKTQLLVASSGCYFTRVTDDSGQFFWEQSTDVTSWQGNIGRQKYGLRDLNTSWAF